MRVVHSLFSTLCAVAAQAQYIIDLSEHTLDTIDPGVVVDSVITPFDDRAPIGTVMKGAFNRFESAYLPVGTDKALLDLVYRSYPIDRDAPGITLKVNRIEVREGSGTFSERAACSMHVEFLGKIDGRVMRLFEHGTTVSRSGLDVTHHHGALIARALSECFNAFVSEQSNGELKPVLASRLDLPTTVDEFDLPILRAPALRQGVYATFDDFRYNRIDTTIALKVRELDHPHAMRKELKILTADMAVTGAWGCTDGQRLYVNTGARFTELRPEGGSLTTFITTTIPPSAGGMAAIVGAGILFGMLGGAVSGAVVYSTTEVKVALDPLTGAFEPYTTGTATRSVPVPDALRSRHVFGFSKYSTSDSTVCMFVYDGQEACLQRREYYDYRPVRRADPIPIELRTAGGQSARVFVDTNDPDDQFFLVKVNSDGEITVDLLNDQMASDLLDHLDPSMEVKGTGR